MDAYFLLVHARDINMNYINVIKQNSRYYFFIISTLSKAPFTLSCLKKILSKNNLFISNFMFNMLTPDIFFTYYNFGAANGNPNKTPPDF